MMPPRKTRADFPTTLKYKHYILSITFPDQFKATKPKLQSYSQKLYRQIVIDPNNSKSRLFNNIEISEIKPQRRSQIVHNESSVADFQSFLNQFGDGDVDKIKKKDCLPVTEEISEKSNSMSPSSKNSSHKFIKQNQKAKIEQMQPEIALKIKHTQSQPEPKLQIKKESQKDESILAFLQDDGKQKKQKEVTAPVKQKVDLLKDDSDQQQLKAERLRQKARLSKMGGSKKNSSMFSKTSSQHSISQRQKQFGSSSPSLKFSLSTKQQQKMQGQKIPLLKQLKLEQQINKKEMSSQKQAKFLQEAHVGESIQNQQKGCIIPEQLLDRQPVLDKSMIREDQPVLKQAQGDSETPLGDILEQIGQIQQKSKVLADNQQVVGNIDVQINAEQQQNQQHSQQQSTRHNQDYSAKLSSVLQSKINPQQFKIKSKPKIDLNQSSQQEQEQQEQQQKQEQQQEQQQQQQQQQEQQQVQCAIVDISIDGDQNEDRKQKEESSQEEIMGNTLVLRFLDQYRKDVGRDWFDQHEEQPANKISNAEQEFKQPEPEQQEQKIQQASAEKSDQSNQAYIVEQMHQQIQTQAAQSTQMKQVQIQTSYQQPTISSLPLQQMLKKFSLLEQTLTVIATRLNQTITNLTQHINVQNTKINVLQSQSRENKENNKMLMNRMAELQSNQNQIKKTVDSHGKQFMDLREEVKKLKDQNLKESQHIEERISQTQIQLSQQIHRLGQSMFESSTLNSTKSKK